MVVVDMEDMEGTEGTTVDMGIMEEGTEGMEEGTRHLNLEEAVMMMIRECQ